VAQPKPQAPETSFDETLALEDQTFVHLLLAASDVYDEYVRALDDVPVLRDAVALPPPPPPDFRRGERPNLRKEPRGDSAIERGRRAAETEDAYREYAALLAAGGDAAPAPKRGRNGGSSKRGKPRTANKALRAAPNKKRAKRTNKR
jgi:hypothetical protein